MRTALQHHQAGRYADAAREYQAWLERNPFDAEALHLFGVLHQQCGYPDRAAQLIGQAIALRPGAAAFHSNLAEAHRSLKRYDLAADCCRTALRLQPDYPEALNNLGLALHDLGRYEEAVAQFDAALLLRPDHAVTQNNRGTSLLALGQAALALEAYRTAVRLEPGLALARANLGQLLVSQDRPDEGLLHCQEAVRLQPDSAAAHNGLGKALEALKRWGEARTAYAEALRLEPGLALVWANLGVALQHEGRLGEALRHLRRAAELVPEDARIQHQLATAHAIDEDWAAAVACQERRAGLEPENADAHCDLGWAYQADGRSARADAAYRRALELQPDHLDAWLNLGMLREEDGAMAGAEACYRQAEARHPQSPVPLARRAVLMRKRLPDADRDRLRLHLEMPLAPSVRQDCLFALAQVADARGDHAEAAACLEPANALAMQQRRDCGQQYDPDEHTRFVDGLISAFTPELFARLGAGGHETPQPVFVFGMPRSGTTLIEQVLASHSQVHGAGELVLARLALDSLSPADSGPGALDATSRRLDDAAIKELARGYLAGVRALLTRRGGDPDSPRVVDKLPDNYLSLGLIALMFPRATLIHVRRDLRDVALSCWLTQFRGIRWADDIDHLARRCQDYLRLMDHWRAVLPRAIHEVAYEQVVADFEPEARRLVAACGLAWEPGCLWFHETARPVRTASVTQVRQPLYRQSVARWKAYEPYLGRLFGQLNAGQVR